MEVLRHHDPKSDLKRGDAGEARKTGSNGKGGSRPIGNLRIDIRASGWRDDRGVVANRNCNEPLISNPDAGEAASNSQPVPPDKLRPIVNNFLGSVGNVAQQS